MLTDNSKITISTSDLASGVYILKIENKNITHQKKIVINKL